MIKRILLILFTIFMSLSFAQENRVEDLVEKIELKLRKDKDYLNIHYLMLYPSQEYPFETREFPRTDQREDYQVMFEDNVSYRLVFLMEGLGLDSLYLLYLDEITADVQSEEGLFGGLATPQDDTLRVLRFRDMYNLKVNHSGIYNQLQNYVNRYIQQNPDDPPTSLLGINPDQNIRTSLGVSSRDNTDYFNYVRAHNIHWFPGGEQEQQATRGSRRERAGGTTDFKVDFSFSKLGFSHKFMNELLEDGAASIEVSAEEDVVNVLPWQSNSISGGIRMLFLLSSADKVEESTFMNAKFAARFNLGTTSLYENQPYILGDDPLLNFANAFIGELNFTRVADLPFINIYFAAGSDEYTDPAVTVTGDDGNTYGYFTNSQAMFSLSFYWNTSDEKTSRLRLDLGGGMYDIVEARYNNNGGLIGSSEVKNDILPMMMISYTWAPRNNPLISTEARFFDSIVRVNAWLTFLRIQPNHTFRFGARYITQPFFRSQKPWETDGGAFIELRYRYGL